MLFLSAVDDNEEINIDLLISLFENAKNQLGDDGQPLNMLGRCNSKELVAALHPHLSTLTVPATGTFLGKLVELNLLNKEDFSTLFQKVVNSKQQL